MRGCRNQTEEYEQSEVPRQHGCRLPKPGKALSKACLSPVFSTRSMASPFSSPFASADAVVEGSPPQPSSPRRVVGFCESSSPTTSSDSSGMQRAYTTGACFLDRQGSLGALLKGEQKPKMAKLAINTGRGRGPGTRVHKVPRISRIEELKGGQPPATARALQLPAAPPTLQLARAQSNNIDIPLQVR